MGNCCVTSSVQPPPHSHSAANSDRRATSPPLDQPLPEEETVKEVLSETPTLTKSALPGDDGPHKNPPLTKDQENRQNDVGLTKPAAAAAAVDSNPDDLSEGFSGSEICSTLGESVPATAADGKLDGVTQRSPASVLKRPLPGGEARRERISEPSPGRVRSGAGRGSAGRPSANGPRKGSPEKIGRRSVSPATRAKIGGAGTGLGRTPSMRKSGKSPGRVRPDLSDKTRMLEGSFRNHNNGGQNWETTTKSSNELLENPLVSLECFIFL